MIQFVVVYLFMFLPGVINDIRLVKSVFVLDELVLSVISCYLVNNSAGYIILNPWSVLCVAAGLQIACLERFIVGFCFHSGKKVELWHEDYHEELRRRRNTHEYLITDHFLELLAYTVVFSAYALIIYVSGIDGAYAHFTWLGIIGEHYLGLKLRLRVQYGVLSDFKNTFFDKFFRNASVFYWYHIMINPRTCLGFSSPWFDTQFGTNPFKSKWSFSSPFPFVDFFFVDYSPEEALINKTFKVYNSNAARFLAQSKTDIKRRYAPLT